MKSTVIFQICSETFKIIINEYCQNYDVGYICSVRRLLDVIHKLVCTQWLVGAEVKPEDHETMLVCLSSVR